MALGHSFIRALKKLEKVGSSVFTTKAAADEALDAVRSEFAKRAAARRGGDVGTADVLIESLLKRARAVPRGVARTGFHIAVKGENKATAVALKNLVRDVRVGRVTEVLDALNVPPDSAFRNAGFVQHVRRSLIDTYPDAVVRDLTPRLREVPEVPAVLFDKTTYNWAEDLTRLITADRHATALVRALEKTLHKGRPVVAKGLFFGVTLTVGGIGAISTALAEGAKRAAGCWRVYRDGNTGELRACRVRYASCEIEFQGGGGLPFDKYCDRYPAVITERSCAEEWNGDTPCVHCDPTASDGSVGLLHAEEYAKPHDMYVCRSNSSLGEMLGQFVLDSPHVLREAAADVVDGASSMFGGLWQAVKHVALWCVALGLLVLAAAACFLKVTHGSEKSRYERLLNHDSDGVSESASAGSGGVNYVRLSKIETRLTHSETRLKTPK